MEKKEAGMVGHLQICDFKSKIQDRLSKSLKEVREKALRIFGVKVLQAKEKQQA